MATLVGCAADSPGQASGSATTSTGSASTADCEAIPAETAGPYPGNGTNGPNILRESGIVRSDIRGSFGSASGVAAGVALAISLTVLDTSAGCAPLSGAAVYLWQCDRNGDYSMYSPSIATENYLRGVQEADASGTVGFSSVFPGCYSGRWPHLHFEVYPSLDAATDSANQIVTSQLAFPPDICAQVYATAGYEQSELNLARVSLDTDNVFRDGWTSQLGTMSGSVASGLQVGLAVPI
ncbi:MAG: hypothetical protein L0Y54_04410 [Sporichthyaceae bacterium]|nr:hypothetical protein [Sporichthyaceae bacterium]